MVASKIIHPVPSPVVSGVTNAPDGAAANPLIAKVIAFYELEEISGNPAVDDINGYDLAETGIVDMSVGKVGDARFNDGSVGQYLTSTAPQLFTDDTNYCYIFWINLNGNPPSIQTIGGHDNGGSGFRVEVNTSRQIRTFCQGNGSASAFNTTATLTVGVYAMVVAGHLNGSLIYASVNAGTVETQAHTHGNDGATNFRLFDGASDPLDASLDQFVVLNQQPTQAEIEWFYNSGNGRSYAEFAAL